MPERWERELQRLRTVERPAGLEERIAEGPRHEPGRPPRQRVVAAAVAFAVCVAVAVVAIWTIRDDVSRRQHAAGVPVGEGSVVLELSSDGQGPTATLRYGDHQQKAVFESGTWCPDGEGQQCSSYIADFAFYPPVSEFLAVPPGTPITVTGDGSIEKVDVTDPLGEPVPGAGGDATVPAADGMYVFDVDGTWSQGRGHFFFGIQALANASQAPDVLTLDCSSFVGRLTETTVVRTRSDGLHVRVIGGSGGFAIGEAPLDGTGPAEAAISHDDRDVIPLAPGSWGIRCGTDMSSGLLAPFELVDPDDHYAPATLTCGTPEEVPFVSAIPTTAPHVQAAAVLMAGRVAGDQVRGAGYGADRWRLGPTYVVDRDGRAVARLVLGETGGVWGGTFATCDASGVALSGLATPPSRDATADTLVVRCEGLGPAVDSAVVRLQPDGLHLEATNIADAEYVVVESDDGEIVGGPIRFDQVTETAALDVAAGSYWVGCLVGAPEGGPLVGRAEHPEAFTAVQVVGTDDATGATGSSG
jgi:hypothetical protein